MTNLMRAGAIALALLTMPTAVMAQSFDDAQKREIGEIVRQYLLDNPEVLVDVSKALEEKQQADDEAKRGAVLTTRADDIYRSEADHVAGNPKGDVTMVEFFDYNCGWCKKGLPEVMALLDDDKQLRFVLKEFPIFGGDSDYAAKAAIAARRQGKYWELHVAMLGHEGKVTRDAVDELAKAKGLDVDKLKADMESPEVGEIIRKNSELAQQLSINGTPAFIIGDKVVPGYLPKDGLMASIKGVRDAGGCQIC